ncbi:ATP-binding cassette sub-family A member 2-like [Glandiceps talaboti]
MTETTLEQIFLQVTQDERIEANVNGAKECTGGNEGITTLSTTNSMTLEMPQDSDDDQVLILEDDVDNGCGSNGKAKTKCTAISLICLGLVIKRLQYTKRDVKTLFSQLLLPVVFIMLAIGIATMTFNIQTDSSLTMTTSMYISDTMYVPYTNEMNALQEDVPTDEFDEIFVDKLIETLYYPAGLGATCLLSSPFNSTLDGLLRTNTSIELSSKDFNQICQKTVPESLRVTFPYMESQPPVSFSANSSEGTCYNSPVMENPGDMKTIDVPSYQVISGDIVQNLTDKNMIQYLLQTRDQYALERYGALSFGGIRTFVPKDFNRNLNVSSPFRRLATRNTAAAWYVMDSQQSIAVYVNLINNAILRANVDPSSHGNPSAYGITVINEPIQTENSLILDFVHRCIFLQVAIFILLGMSFIPASVMVFLVSERASKAKHLHFISGVSPFVYWISNYVWDMLMFLLPVACCVVVLLVFDVPVFSTSTNLPALVALFILFGWSVIPMMYPASFLFDVPNNAYVMLLVFNMFLGFGTTVGMFFIQNLGSGQVMISLGNVLDKVLVFFPHYCLGHGLVQLSFYDMLNTFYKQIGEYEKVRHPFEWDILSHMLVVMAIEGFVFLGFTLLCEYGYFSRFKRKSGLKSVQQYSIIEGEEDGDVVQERQRVLRESDQDVLRLLNLTKVYDVKKKKKSLTNSLLAVDKICLGVPQGQCFGLLGINGAGKTTLFQMLTGDKSITSGDAYLHGYSIAKNVREAYKHMGYCPQYDTLYDKLTGREHLYLYTRLHGIPARQRKEVVDSTLERLNLLQYADRLAGTYSGGNKRKLSTAISLIGNPSVIFMDEPTSGMDPQSKRFLWNVIHDVVKSGTSVIFTSHSMEECENLCSRLAIMVNGQFKCIGSIQHLKSKFGDGYTITIIPNKNQPKEQQIKSLFQHEFPESVLKDCHFNMVQFELKSRSLSDIFSKLEGMKETLDIEDYSVRQTTLDDVFVNFAKKQHKSSYVQQKSMEEIQDQETVTQGTTDLTNLVQLQTLPATVV